MAGSSFGLRTTGRATTPDREKRAFWGARRGRPSLRNRGRWFEDYSLTGAAVHYYSDGFREAQVADTALLFHGRLFRQPSPIYGAFARVWIHGEITDLEGGQVLEEMAALRGSHSEVAETGFDYYAGAADLVPLYWNTQPGFSRSPASDADEQIGTIVFVELAIETGNGRGDFLALATLEAL